MTRIKNRVPILEKGVPNPIAIVGDGQLETIYFTQLRDAERALPLTVVPQLPHTGGKGGTHMKVINKAKELFEEDNYFRIYCLIDYDTIVGESKEQAYQATKEQLTTRSRDKIVFVENHPCFEVWFLLHFEFPQKSWTRCDEVIRALKNHLPDYKKTGKYYDNKQLYRFLKPQLCKMAMQYAVDSDTRHAAENHHGRSQLYKLFADLNICP